MSKTKSKRSGPLPRAAGYGIRDSRGLNSPRYALGRAFRRDVRGGAGLTHLSRCEAILERGLYRAMRELQVRRCIKKQNEPGEARMLTP